MHALLLICPRGLRRLYTLALIVALGCTAPVWSQERQLVQDLAAVDAMDPALGVDIRTQLGRIDSFRESGEANTDNGEAAKFNAAAVKAVGGLMEFKLAQDFGLYEQPHLKGSELSVGGKKQADFWMMEESDALVLSGMVEIKSSLAGYLNRGRWQIYGFIS